MLPIAFSAAEKAIGNNVPAYSTGVTPPAAPSRAYSNYVLGVLVLAYIFNWVDRNALAVLMPDMKRELGVSDTAMGFLSGPAFAIFYTLLGIPIGRWADIGNRRSILALGLALWSAMTGVCGLAQSFAVLALARVGVGVGEAAGSPTSHSLIADYFPPARRGRALAVYGMGNYGGHFVAFVIGGWINHHYGWRNTFLAMGLPGLLLALLIRASVREPQRAAPLGVAPRAASFASALRYLASRRSYLFLNLGGALSALVGYGFGIWTLTFFVRVHGLEPSEASRWLGILGPIGGLCGTALGGVLVDRLASARPSAYLWIPAISSLLHLPLALALLLGSREVALAAYLPHSLAYSMYVGPLFAVMQGVAPPRMRSLAVAIHMLIVNLLGLAAGPMIVGALNDSLHEHYGDASVRYSLLLVSATGVVAAALYAAGARSVGRDLAHAAADRG